MSDYDLATKRLLYKIAEERVTALSKQANADMVHIPAGARIPGRAGTLNLGDVTIPESKPSASITDNAAFTKWVEAEWPHEMRDAIRPGYATDPRVIALVKEHLPQLVEQVVSPVFREEVVGSVLAHGGFHDENSEVQPVPGVERDPGGKALTPTALLDKDVKAMARNPLEPLPIEMVSGFGEIGLGVLALPAGGSDG